MADSSHVDSNVITTATDSTGATIISVVQSNVTESSRVDSVITTGGKGDTGESGYTPVKGVDYFDGENGTDGTDGRNPLTVSATEPASPQEGDLWYQP